jgi:hypothetical protein
VGVHLALPAANGRGNIAGGEAAPLGDRPERAADADEQHRQTRQPPCCIRRDPPV